MVIVMSYGCMYQFMMHVDDLSLLIMVVVTVAAAAPALGISAITTNNVVVSKLEFLMGKTQ